MAYERELDFLVKTIKKAYDKISKEEMAVEDKGRFDNVTNIDYGMEKIILAEIEKNFHEDNVVSEEFHPGNSLSGRCWTVDPIDGTVNMAHRNKLFGVQAAFLIGNEIKAAVLYLPEFGEWFTAVDGGGTYLNGEKLSVSKRNLENCMVTLGDFAHRRADQAEQQFNLIKRIYNRIGKLRLLGAASVDFAFIAAGRTDGMIMFTQNLWDIAPGWLIVKEAGANVTNLKGEPYQFGMDEIVVTASEELKEIMLEK